MTLTALLEDLGADADYLVKSDAWLEEQRKHCATEVDDLVNQLRVIMLAQQIKKLLQSHNKVAVQELIKSGEHIKDIEISIADLPSAINRLKGATNSDELINVATQFEMWKSDGYDIEGSSELADRKLKK